MKILGLHNTNPFAISLFDWLVEQGETVELYSEKIDITFFYNQSYDFVISYTYDYKVPKDILDLFGDKIINLHISLLPWNKGFSPNIWSFLDGTPKGVTIHKMSEGIDEGDIICQRELTFGENETLKSSYDKLNYEIIELFKENWKDIKVGNYSLKPQIEIGTVHTNKDLSNLEKLIEFTWDDMVSDVVQKYRSIDNR